jgi:hypothetical protein
MRNHDFVSDGFLALTAGGLVLLCSSLVALAFAWGPCFPSPNIAPSRRSKRDCPAPIQLIEFLRSAPRPIARGHHR